MKTFLEFIAMVIAYLIVVFGITTHINLLETFRLTAITCTIIFGCMALAAVNALLLEKVLVTSRETQ